MPKHTHWRKMLLWAIEQHAPSVLANLAREPFRLALADRQQHPNAYLIWDDDSRAVQHDLARPPRMLPGLTTAVLAWASRYHIPELVPQAVHTLHNWALRGEPDSQWNAVSHEIIIRLKVDYAPFTFTCDPSDYGSAPEYVVRHIRAAFEAELDRYMAPYRETWRRHKERNPDPPPPPVKHAATKHFEWRVRYQCLGESVNDIVADLPPDRKRRKDARPDDTGTDNDRRMVARAIRATARVADLNPRPPVGP